MGIITDMNVIDVIIFGIPPVRTPKLVQAVDHLIGTRNEWKRKINRINYSVFPQYLQYFFPSSGVKKLCLPVGFAGCVHSSFDALLGVSFGASAEASFFELSFDINLIIRVTLKTLLVAA